ncbi:hypothetical protein JYK22_42175, partial [Nonomuraea sp. RK-328]|nr:hypothetical protein [Nonomuraea sp. RK-328]
VVSEVPAFRSGGINKVAACGPHGLEGLAEFSTYSVSSELFCEEGSDLEGRVNAVIFIVDMPIAEEEPTVF